MAYTSKPMLELTDMDFKTAFKKCMYRKFKKSEHRGICNTASEAHDFNL